MPPVAGTAWLDQFSYHPARLSNGLATDREWSAFSFTSCQIRGSCDLEVVRNALSDEGVYPVGAQLRDGEPLKAMATLVFNVVHDSVCGAYNEVVLSFDVNHSNPESVAFRSKKPTTDTWALQYGNFGPSVCDAQFFHSLWIDSPLSITWGREMQASPKHPKPVSSTLSDSADAFAFDLSWDGRNVMRGRTAKPRGPIPFVRQALGLVGAHGLGSVARFLAAPSFDTPMIMPTKIATEHGVTRDYVVHAWKGRSVGAVKVWPWAVGDSLEFGDVSEPTGCEEHNGQVLLREAGFQPLSVVFLPRGSAVVESADQHDR